MAHAAETVEVPTDWRRVAVRAHRNDRVVGTRGIRAISIDPAVAQVAAARRGGVRAVVQGAALGTIVLA